MRRNADLAVTTASVTHANKPCEIGVTNCTYPMPFTSLAPMMGERLASR